MHNGRNSRFLKDSKLGLDPDFPEGLSDQEKEQFREVLKVVKSDSTGFLNSAIIEAIRDPGFKQRVDVSLKKRAIVEAAAFMSGCNESLKLDPSILQVILGLPSNEIQALASTAEALSGRQLSVSPEIVKDVCDQAIVMRVMEAESMKKLGAMGERSEKMMDSMEEEVRS